MKLIENIIDGNIQPIIDGRISLEQKALWE
jgi:hypothetical protein